jgi:hypothetical protein
MYAKILGRVASVSAAKRLSTASAFSAKSVIFALSSSRAHAHPLMSYRLTATSSSDLKRMAKPRCKSNMTLAI